MKFTRQGVRDLNPPGQSNPRRRGANLASGACSHVWESERHWDCDYDCMMTLYHCRLCQETRR